MTRVLCSSGQVVYLAFVDDVEPNKGGYYVEVYLDPNGDRWDDFCVPDLGDRDAMEQYAIDYAKMEY